jgi:hypothetical protein
MARKSAVDLVLSQMIPVDPEGSQPTYIRSGRAVQTSEDLIAHQQCVGDKMKDMDFAGQAEVREAFSSISNECS